jgi:hypothetical protein
MRVTDKNLRNRAAVAAGNHFFAKLRVIVHIYLRESHVLLHQQLFGSLTIRAPIGYVDGHRRLRHFELLLPPVAVFASGMFSFTQALSPP